MNVTLPPRLVKPKPRREIRLRCRPHRDFVRSHGCIVPGCMDGPIEVMHVRKSGDGGGSFKPGDQFTVSGCVRHHVEQHAIGEYAFERKYNVDLLALAAAFWAAFRRTNPAAVRRAEQKVCR